jgi:hypothetical protein
MSETDIKREILQMITEEFPTVRVTRHQSGIVLAAHGRRIHLGEPGWPDIIGYLPDGRFIGIEAKAPGAKKQRHEPGQQTRGLDITECGGEYFIARSTDEARLWLRQALEAL